jgi:hypothetical protein
MAVLPGPCMASTIAGEQNVHVVLHIKELKLSDPTVTQFIKL